MYSNRSIYSFINNETSIDYFELVSDNMTKVRLKCPYEDTKFKRLHEDEISHLPMRLAINPGFDEDKRAAQKYLAGLKVFSFVK